MARFSKSTADKKLGNNEHRTAKKVNDKENTKGKRRLRNKGIIRMGTWNIRTLMTVGKIEEIGKQMKEYKIEILALQETRWKGEGQIDRNNYTLLYGGEDKQGKRGTGFMISKTFKERILEYRRINGRISLLRLKNKPANLTLINTYAPTEDRNNDEKDAFYETLIRTCREAPKHDTLIIMGDLNAMIGKEEYIRTVAGKETMHQSSNDNGIRVCNLASELDMFIVSTKFKHRPEHKITWLYPGKTYGNQIDHVLIAKKRRRMIQDVRAYRGTTVDTDHQLVIVKAKINTIGTSKKQKRKQVRNFNELEIKRTAYRKNIGKLIGKEAETEGIESEWETIKTAIIKATDKTCTRRQQTKKNEWFDESCQTIIKNKRKLRLQWIRTKRKEDYEKYKEMRKRGTVIFKKKKSEWINNIMDNLDKQNHHNARLYQYIRKQNRKTFIANIECEEWEKYFHSLLNNPTIAEEREMRSETTSTTEQHMPTKEELQKIINKLKTHKAVGPDDIANEQIKLGGQKLVSSIYNLIIKIWIAEKMPAEWEKGIIIPILKKGNPMLCTNYRGITLLNSTYKILTTLLNNKVKQHTEERIQEYQQGFRQGRSTVDAIHIIKQIIEKSYEHNIEIQLLFIDFKQAFDCLKRDAITKDMKRMKIPDKIIRLTQMTMDGSRAVINTRDGLSKEVEITRGVRQGDGLSATLFIIALDGVINDCELEGTIITKEVQMVAYADDLVIIARNTKSMQDTLNKTVTSAEKRGLHINIDKSKYMVINRKGNQRKAHNINIGGHNFEVVDSFKYLGVIINNKNMRSMEISQRIHAGHRAYYKYRHIMQHKRISRSTKMRVYKTAIRPTVTYAAETMNITKSDEEKIKIFERQMIRKIYGPKVVSDDHVQILMNHEIDKILDGDDIVKNMKVQRLRWYGHIMRMNKNRLVRKITEWKPRTSRHRGRPASRWEDQAIEDMRSAGIKRWWEQLQDRDKWKTAIMKAKRKL